MQKTSNDWVGNFLTTAESEKVYKFDRRDAWGYCCAMDLVDCDPHKIRDKASIERFIKMLCNTIKAKPYGAPTIARIGEGKRLFGWSFTQLVTTSSITGHFVESNNSCYIDVFFCNWFDPDVAVKFTRGYFEAKKIRVKLFTRSEPDES